MYLKKLTLVFSLVSLLTFITACDTGSEDTNNPAVGDASNSTPEIEPNNDPSSAQVISLPITLAGTVNDTSDYEDGFAITLASAATNTFTLDSFDPSQYDLDLALYDGSSELAFSDSITSTESISYSLNAGIIYYIVVSAFDTSGSSVSYRLNIQ